MFWKIYFWFLVSIILVSLVVGGFAVPELFTNPFDMLNMLFMVIGLVGVYGYAYKKTVGSRDVWLIILIITLFYQLLYSFVLDQKYGAAPVGSAVEGITTFIPLIPMYIALKRYALGRKSRK